MKRIAISELLRAGRPDLANVVAYTVAAGSIDLADYGLAGLVAGNVTVLYHGTTASFKTFDVSKSRESLVKNYYGGGIFLTPSKDIAEAYATANRNIGFPPSIIDEVRRKSRAGGELLQSMYDHGYELGWEKWQKKMNVRTAAEIEKAVGFDPNLLNDIAEYIIGSKVRPLGSDNVNIFSQSTGMPGYVYDTVDQLGLDSKQYRPKVYTVTVKCRNPLVTASKAQAKKARSAGYDCVVFHGADLVRGVPEVAIFDPKLVKVRKVEIVD